MPCDYHFQVEHGLNARSSPKKRKMSKTPGKKSYSFYKFISTPENPNLGNRDASGGSWPVRHLSSE